MLQKIKSKFGVILVVIGLFIVGILVLMILRSFGIDINPDPLV